MYTQPSGGSTAQRFRINSGGDISFYEDTGTTPKFFWDASAERLGLGTTSPSAPLEVSRSNTGIIQYITNTGSTQAYTAYGNSDNPPWSQDFGTPGGLLVGIDADETAVVYQGGNYALRFGTNAEERMRIDSSGRLLVGTASNYGGEALQIDANSVGATVYTAYISNTNTSTSAYNVMRWAQGAAGSATGMIGTGGSATGNVAFRNSFVVGTQSSSPLVFATGDAERARIDSSGNLLVGTTSVPSQSTGVSSGVYFVVKGDIIPSVDAGLTGHSDLGDPSTRYEDAYVRDGVTTGSDGRDKQDIEELSDAEQRVAVACKGLLRKWRWKSSVAEKGDDARIHFGIIAQDLQAAFEAEGLDAGRYAMFIHSTWTDEETGEERSRMGVRYSELLAFIIAAL